MDKSVHIITRTRYGTGGNFGAQEQGSRVEVPATVEIVIETDDDKKRLTIDVDARGKIGKPKFTKLRK